MFKRYIWKGIVTDYEISDTGEVKSLKTNKLLSQINAKGYRKVTLSIYDPAHPNQTKQEREKKIFVHRLVAETFIPNPENKPMVNHIDGNKANNNVSNLEWCTQKENMIHAFKYLDIGRRDQYGEKNSSSIYKESQIHELCKLIEGGITNIKQLHEMTGIGEGTIIAVKNGDQWTEISKQYKMPEVNRKPRMSEDTVYEICKILAKDGETSFTQIAKDFGVYRKTIERIYNKKCHARIASKFNFVERVNTRCDALKAAASYLCMKGLKKKDIKIRKCMNKLDKKYFDVSYDIAKLNLDD